MNYQVGILEDIATLDRSILQMLNGSGVPFLDGFVLTFTNGTTWIPFYIALLLVIIRRHDVVTDIAVVVLCTLSLPLLAGGLNDLIIKPLVARPRPLSDPIFQTYFHVIGGYRAANYSFLSSHAANTFALALFLSRLFRSHAFSCVIITWSLVNCWTRLYLAVHYPSDIFCGLLWGTMVFLIVNKLYNRLSSKISIPPPMPVLTPSGYRRSDIRMLLLVFSLSVTYCLCIGLASTQY